MKMLNHNNRLEYNQYFTPKEIVESAVNLLDLKKPSKVIDPSAGEGIFLDVVCKKWENCNLFGIDIDDGIIKKCRDKFKRGTFYVGNALLDKYYKWSKYRSILNNGKFDLVVGNPPFSSWFDRVKEKKILELYELGKKQKQRIKQKQINLFKKEIKKILSSQAIEILFLEKFIEITKNNGNIVIVLPDGILSNPKYQYVREFILKKCFVKYILNLPRNIFKHTSAKTSVLILEKRDNETKLQEEKTILIKVDFKKHKNNLKNKIKINSRNLGKRMDYNYYDIIKNSKLDLLQKREIKLAELNNFITCFKTGKTLYGKQRIFTKNGLRFLHATNIAEIGINYKKDERFIEPNSPMDFKNAYVKINDILFVRVGVGCAGRVAVVLDEKDIGVASDYIHILRVKDINPYYVAIYLKTKFGKESIEVLKHGVGTISINKSDVCSIQIPVVSIKIQEGIEKKYKKVHKEWKSAIDNNYDLCIFEKKMKNIIKELENILESNKI
ncbi:MAG: hypothetical protein B6U87_00970 [Candidatus Aenigmarchaeota archaeon ex4484_52]|nr:MAG: hypothetical protein B6U87_00970 [Candidatus Aenigmarchaeota archaeon ex4484_52]